MSSYTYVQAASVAVRLYPQHVADVRLARVGPLAGTWVVELEGWPTPEILRDSTIAMHVTR